MQVRALGPLTILAEDGGEVSLPPKPRQVFALLVAYADHAVASEHLLEELWDQHPPRSATATLQTYVGQIRRAAKNALGDNSTTSANEIILTVGRGYMLSSKSLHIDLLEFKRLKEEGEEALRAGKYTEASATLTKALDLWRGPSFVNVDCGARLSPLVARLEECRLSVVEHRVIADLQLGNHHSLVSELAELTAAHPLHESLHMHLMLALYRCDRRAEGLAVYRDLRRRLVTELGLEPSSSLTEMQHAILVGDRALDRPPGTEAYGPSSPSARPAPHRRLRPEGQLRTCSPGDRTR
ncbi:BTAD domain-containing putative transcriptional regulator [Microbispora sp. NBC_01389]|uniref:AfsR/SARP family transcriptional regulator n=1 Tax=Microbispora sp. NBC_01389 TaxID=2903584 RepID=UPI003245E405